MNKHDQNGSINGLLVALILVSLLFVISTATAAVADTSRQDYKNNTDQKITAAVQLARQNESTAKDRQFAELDKKPLRSYSGPQAYGSLVVQYPKTWSAYVDDSGKGASQIDGYFHPAIVPSLTNNGSIFALRVRLLTQDYSSVLAALRGNETTGKITVAPFALAKVPSVVGVQIDGQIKPGKTGTMILLPLRDKTIEISTEGGEFSKDFMENILPNLSFSP